MEKQDVKYPIKYAVMPIVKQVGFQMGSKRLEKLEDVVCNIVSKCYVLLEEKEYFSSGGYRISYDVIFPYDNDGKNLKKITTVSKIYDNYEDAIKDKDIANERILSKNCGFVPFNGDFSEVLNKYNLLEKRIESKTSDMKVLQEVYKKLMKTK